MSTNISETLNIESEEELIDIKFAINDVKKPTTNTIVDQAAKIVDSHKQGLTSEYTDY